MAGRFEDLLIAAVTHPVMVAYLDQNRSVGPNAEKAGKRGLAEVDEIVVEARAELGEASAALGEGV